MPYYDSVGNQVDAVSQYELEEIRQQKDAELSELQQQFETAQAELKKRDEEIAKLKDKDLNFAQLRAQKAEAEKKADQLKSEIDEKLTSAKKEIFEGVLKDHYSEALSNLAGDDEELKKKIEHHYQRLSDAATSKGEIDKKLRDAWSLATATDEPLHGAAFSSGYVSRVSPQQPKNFSNEEKELAKKLAQAGGLSLEDKDFQ